MLFDAISPYLIVAAIVGAGMVTGLLFAFSNFVMDALAELQPDQGMLAMQQINERIINPIFLVFFLGTPLLCLAIAVYCLLDFGSTHSLFLLTGSIGYIVGPLGITVFRNVPMNNELAATEPGVGAELWRHYQVNWQRWNHLRTYIGLVSIVFLCVGLWLVP